MMLAGPVCPTRSVRLVTASEFRPTVAGLPKHVGGISSNGPEEVPGGKGDEYKTAYPGPSVEELQRLL
jgi:hypothetical protein